VLPSDSRNFTSRRVRPPGCSDRSLAEGRQGLAQTIPHRAEFRSDQFEGYYEGLLRRPADGAALAGWLASGLDVHAVRVGFEPGSEFFSNGLRAVQRLSRLIAVCRRVRDGQRGGSSIRCLVC
jgi:hypothetical protein